MPTQETSDPVSLVIKACRRSEEEAQRIYQFLAEERHTQIELKDGESVQLTEAQLGEFAQRFSAEVEPLYWESKRLKH